MVNECEPHKYFNVEKEIDAIIYRREYELHLRKYKKAKKEEELIFAFILLHIYIECFLHQNMRKIVELEFKPPRDSVSVKWLQEREENRHISEKLDHFGCLFFAPVPVNIQQLIGTIKDYFANISKIRNLFVHGHKVASWFNSSGNAELTLARSMLTDNNRMKQTVIEMNELGVTWNTLLDNILPQCLALRGVYDFRFSSLRNI